MYIEGVGVHMERFFNKPIEEKRSPSSKNIVLKETNEKFVDVYTYSNGEIKVDMQYYKIKLPSAIPIAYVRETVAKKLTEAKTLLPKGYTFQILDAWRPYNVQFALFDNYRKQIIANNIIEMKEDELIEKVCEFVSFPNKSKQMSYVHSTGGAIDITI